MRCPVCDARMLIYCHRCHLWNASEHDSKKHTITSDKYCKIFFSIGRYQLRGDNIVTTIERPKSALTPNDRESQIASIGIKFFIGLKPFQMRKYWGKWEKLERLLVML